MWGPQLKPGASTPHRHFTPHASWNPLPVSFVMDTLPCAKALCSATDLNKAKNMFLSIASQPESAAILTDGSDNQQSSELGSAFTCWDYTYNRRINNGASTLQSEQFAIKTALTQAIHLTQSNICLLSDSLSAQHALWRSSHQDDIHLITSVIFKLYQLTMTNPSHSSRYQFMLGYRKMNKQI